MRCPRNVVLGAVSVLFVAPAKGGGMWSAQPLVVHEWGVGYYDWSKGVAVAEVMPDFIYTDKRPGKPIAPAAPRVKDMPPDSGIRTKPILYFHPEGYLNKAVPVGVEVRFAYGDANAWWPQVTVYRTPGQVADAKPVDWDAWRKKREKERWSRPPPRIPDDKRFELVWHHLTLSKERPAGVALGGADLPDDHWVKVARQVDAYYVSNGKQAEKYLFYEGTTRRTPVVTVLPPEWQDKNHHLVNVGEHPIHDVFAVYRNSERGQVWTQYLATMPPVPEAAQGFGMGHDVPQVVSLPLPDFGSMPAGDPVTEEEYGRRTTGRLLDALTAGRHHTPGWYRGMRDPADHQPPTRMHQLYRDEAVALETIWRKDFFKSEGLTIIYRESPAFLDEAMPLHIHTDMYHYVKLSRCGLVLNRNVGYTSAKAIADAVWSYERDKDAARKAKGLAVCRQNRFLALGQIEYYRRQGHGYGRDEAFGATLIQALNK